MLVKAAQTGRAPLREHLGDCYDTPAVAVEALLRVETTLPPEIWEPAAGSGNIVRVLQAHGHKVMASDIAPRSPNCLNIDFLDPSLKATSPCIVTNPPYAKAEDFVYYALARAPIVVMLLRLAFLESKRRTRILDSGKLARVHVFANRLPMMHRHGWTGKRASSAMPFAWFVWSRYWHSPATIDRIFWSEPDQQQEANEGRKFMAVEAVNGKADRFLIQGEKRMTTLLKSFRNLSKLSQRNRYEFTPEQVGRMFDTLRGELDQMEAKFAAPPPVPKAAVPQFRF